jgi:predicted alpha/beta-hydrolase family hydrolase
MRVVLAHGASGDASSMRRHVDGLVARGIEATAIDLPVRKAETALDAFRTAAALVGEPARPAVIGGHSYGGRVASLVAADGTAAVRGLVLLSYPLHRPGVPEWEPRTAHWPSISVPVLLCSGEGDPFARIELLRRAVAERLPTAELVTWPRLGHTLAPVLDEVLDRVAAFARDR